MDSGKGLGEVFRFVPSIRSFYFVFLRNGDENVGVNCLEFFYDGSQLGDFLIVDRNVDAIIRIDGLFAIQVSAIINLVVRFPDYMILSLVFSFRG